MAKRSARSKPAPKKGLKKQAKRPAAPKRAPTGMSLHIALNEVDPGHYDGWSGPLAACEFDAHAMAAIAKAKNIAPQQLLTKQATRAAVLSGIRNAAKSLGPGDFFFMTYSGHGGQVEDISHDEKDKQDETWCLFDSQLIDDELFLELAKFKKGVRVLVFSDSCHSGTVTRAARPVPPNARLMPPDVARRVYQKHKTEYDRIQRGVMKDAGGQSPDEALAHVAVSNRLTRIAGTCKAAVILISGCQDNQVSLDGVANGAFTEQLLAVWNKGTFKGNYARFHAKILAAMPDTQSPNLFQLGRAAGFAAEQVFTI